MKNALFLLFLIFIAVTPVPCQESDSISFAKYGVYDTDNIGREEYHQRRAAVLMKMDSGSIGIFRANDRIRRTAQIDYKYRQNSNFLYLTGCNEPNSTLVLVHDGISIDGIKNVREILFIRDPRNAGTGYGLGVEGVNKILHFTDSAIASLVLTNERLWDILPRILQSNKVLYYTPSLPDIVFDPVSDRKFVTLREVARGLEEKYPGLLMKNSDSIIDDLRSAKSSTELVLLQKAVDATVEGYIEAIKKCEPGMYEYQLQAVAEYCFTRNGCESGAYPSIIGSGPNSLIVEYENNRRQMKKNELVMIDIGAEYHGYSACITRTIPVSGKYSKAQKEIYELVLNAQEIALADIRPGVMWNVSSRLAMEFIGDGLIKLGIIKDRSETEKYCSHPIGHFVGLDVHDVGWLGMLEPGMVLSIGPGIYIPDSSRCEGKYWGIAVRIEDNVLITEDGYNILSDRAPRSVADIEKIMRKRGKSGGRSGSVKKIIE